MTGFVGVVVTNEQFLLNNINLNVVLINVDFNAFAHVVEFNSIIINVNYVI